MTPFAIKIKQIIIKKTHKVNKKNVFFSRKKIDKSGNNK